MTALKLIILDRDGVINIDSDDYIKSPEEWQPIPGSLEAIAALSQAGYRIAVATNQSGLARGYFTPETLQHIHHKMHNALQALGGKIDFIAYCPHSPVDNCACRKPQPGLLQQIANHFQINLNHIPFVGDSWKDIQAGMAMQCQPVLVRSGNGEKVVQQHAHELDKVLVFDDLAAVAQYLLNTTVIA